MEDEIVVGRELIAFYGLNPCPAGIFYRIVKESEMMPTATGKPAGR